MSRTAPDGPIIIVAVDEATSRSFTLAVTRRLDQIIKVEPIDRGTVPLHAAVCQGPVSEPRARIFENLKRHTPPPAALRESRRDRRARKAIERKGGRE